MANITSESDLFGTHYFPNNAVFDGPDFQQRMAKKFALAQIRLKPAGAAAALIFGGQPSLDKPRSRDGHSCRRSTHHPRPSHQPRASRLRIANADRPSLVYWPRAGRCAGRCVRSSLVRGLRYSRSWLNIASAHISGDEASEVAHGLGDAPLIGRNDLAKVLWVHTCGKPSTRAQSR